MSEEKSCDTCKHQEIRSKGCTRDSAICFTTDEEYALWEPQEPARFQGTRRDHEGFGAEPIHVEDNPDVAYAESATDQSAFTATLESDPTGRDASSPGAKLDAGKPRPALVLGAFAKALDQITAVGTMGANKYSPMGWRSVPNASERYADAMMRHWLKYQQGEINDPESGLPHLAHMAWNVCALIEFEDAA